MANHLAIHSVGASLIKALEHAYPDELRRQFDCAFQLLSSGRLAANEEMPTTLSLFLYRVTINEHLRNRARLTSPGEGVPPLAVDLHYLMTVWSDSAAAEHTIL